MTFSYKIIITENDAKPVNASWQPMHRFFIAKKRLLILPPEKIRIIRITQVTMKWTKKNGWGEICRAHSRMVGWYPNPYNWESRLFTAVKRSPVVAQCPRLWSTCMARVAQFKASISIFQDDVKLICLYKHTISTILKYLDIENHNANHWCRFLYLPTITAVGIAQNQPFLAWFEFESLSQKSEVKGWKNGLEEIIVVGNDMWVC